MNKEQKLQVLYEEYKDCQKCPVLCKSRTQVVFGYGSQEAKILVVARNPGQTEDATGLPLIGASGRILDYFLAKALQKTDDRLRKLLKDFKLTKGFNNRTNFTWGQIDKSTQVYASHWATKQILAKQVFYTNALLCYTENDRKPEKEELENCRARLLETIYIIDPVVILAVGGDALESLVGKRGFNITKWQGHLLDVAIPGKTVDLKYPVMPIYHPSYLMRKPQDGDWDLTEQHISKAVALVEEYTRTNE